MITEETHLDVFIITVLAMCIALALIEILL
jgi:hypothetical protein